MELAILILLFAGVAIMALVVWTVARMEIGGRAIEAVVAAPSRPLSWPLLRTALVAAAALLAVVAAVRLNEDQSAELQPAASLFFVAEAAFAAAIAPAIALRRRAQAHLLGAIVVGGGALELAAFPLSLGGTACACARSAVPYVPPPWLGLDATTWATAALVGVPVLLVVALVPWRR